MAEDLKIARATLAEHLSRIESIVMDYLMGSFSNIKVHPDEYALFKDMIEVDAIKDGYSDDDNFKTLLSNIQEQMKSEILSPDEEEIEESV